MKRVIYETKGRAREFNELAINLFTGCEHQCVYCYGANVTHQSKDAFKHHVKPRVTEFDIADSTRQWVVRGEKRRVLLCFITDPYQPCEQDTQLTRRTIKALHNEGLNVVILTKGGVRSTRDFDLLTPNDAYATTLTCLSPENSLKWEPHASLPDERINALKLAHQRGIETWVSFEPVIYPQDTIALLNLTFPFVNHFKVGTMNYHPHGKTVNWKEYGYNIKRIMDRMGVKYYFKKDLLKEMGINPDQFKQTWTCR